MQSDRNLDDKTSLVFSSIRIYNPFKSAWTILSWSSKFMLGKNQSVLFWTIINQTSEFRLDQTKGTLSEYKEIYLGKFIIFTLPFN